jgi:AraC family transcriptional activator of tynA and feaB
LSSIRSNAIIIERSPKEPTQNSHDAYFAVMPVLGSYMLKQDGRTVNLLPDDMTIYDATRPHRIVCPASFAKVAFRTEATDSGTARRSMFWIDEDIPL